jgi:hypothetical protein
LQKKRRLQEKELNEKRRAKVTRVTASERPAKQQKTSSKEATEDSNKENKQLELFTQEEPEEIRICTGYKMVKTTPDEMVSSGKQGDMVIELEHTHFSLKSFNDLVADKEKSKSMLIEQDKIIAEQKRINDSLQRDLQYEKREYNGLLNKHNSFVTLCSKGGTTKEAHRKKLEADSLGWLEKKKKELEMENKRLKKEVHDLQTFKPVNPSKEMRTKNTMLEKELMMLKRQHEKLEKDHEDLRVSDTHRELAELKDQLKEDKNRDRALEDSINDELEGRKNRIKQLESVVEKLHLQSEIPRSTESEYARWRFG